MAAPIKPTYTKQLWGFLLGNLLLFLVLLFWSEKADTNSVLKLAVAVRAALAGGASLLPLAINGLLSSDTKARLVFWRWHYPLPGCQAFSLHLASDPRIDISRLRSRYPELPQEPQEQNALWYRIYKKHEDSSAVGDAHKGYLLFRDLTFMSFLFALVFGVLSIFLFASLGLSVGYLLVLMVQYFGMAHIARTFGTRFVCTVLAEEAAM